MLQVNIPEFSPPLVGDRPAKRRTHWLALGAIGIAQALVTFGIHCAAAAHAEPNTYLNLLTSNGIPVSNPDRMLQEGYAICKDLRKGIPVAQEATVMQQVDPQLSFEQSIFVINAAEDALCGSRGGSDDY